MSICFKAVLQLTISAHENVVPLTHNEVNTCQTLTNVRRQRAKENTRVLSCSKIGTQCVQVSKARASSSPGYDLDDFVGWNHFGMMCITRGNKTVIFLQNKCIYYLAAKKL